MQAVQGVFQRLQAPERAPTWSAVSGILFVLAYGVVWIAAQALAVTLTGGNLAIPSDAAQALGALVASLLIAVVVIQWVRRRVPKDWQTALHLETSHTLPLFMCLLIGLAGAWAIDLLGILLHLKGGQVVPPAFGALSGQLSVGWIAAAVTALLAQPIGEELLMRGLLYPSLAARAGNLGAIALTSAIGVILSTLLAGPLPWYALIQPALMNVLITGLRVHTQSTQMAIVARSMFGLFFVLTALIQR
ncbi:MAG: CPBP family intramembrane glutamic endopeptidase [Aggregatilineales bacterium]